MVTSVENMAISIASAATSAYGAGAAIDAVQGIIDGVEGAVASAAEAAARNDDLTQAKADLMRAAEGVFAMLMAEWEPVLLPKLAPTWPTNSSVPHKVLEDAAWTVAFATVSKPDKYSIKEFFEQANFFDTGNVIKAFDKPICSQDLPPRSCKGMESVCGTNSLGCSGNWSCACKPGFAGALCNETTGGSTESPDFNALSDEALDADTQSGSGSSISTAVLLGGIVLPVLLVVAAMGYAKHRLQSSASGRSFLSDESYAAASRSGPPESLGEKLIQESRQL
jgi:hypothetical protein